MCWGVAHREGLVASALQVGSKIVSMGIHELSTYSNVNVTTDLNNGGIGKKN